ncbi:MAG: CHAT domain-containing protein [Chitinophagales bacterium]
MLTSKSVKQANEYVKKANILMHNAQYNEAIKLLEKALKVYYQNELWNRYVKTCTYISLNYNHLDTSIASITYLQNALIISEQKIGADHLYVGDVHAQLGISFANNGDYEQSLYHHSLALDMRFRLLGENSIAVAESYYYLSCCYSTKGDYEKQHNYLEKCIFIEQQILPKNHHKFVERYIGFGECFTKKGDCDSGLHFFQKALSLQNKLPSVLPHQMAKLYENMAICYNAKNDLNKSLEYSLQALEILRSIFSETNLRIAKAHNQVGKCYFEMNRITEALYEHQKALKIQEKIVQKHPHIAATYTYIGRCFCYKNNKKEALFFYEKALNLSRSLFGRNNELVASICRFIADVYAKNKDYHNSLNYYQQALTSHIHTYVGLDIYETNIPTNHHPSVELLQVLNSKANIFFKLYLHNSNNIKDLKASFNIYKTCRELITNMQKSYKSEDSKLILFDKMAESYTNAIDVCKMLYDLTGSKEYVFQAFCFAEQGKAIVLLSHVREAEAKASAKIPRHLLEREQELRMELSYYERKINDLLMNGKEQSNLIEEYNDKYFDFRQQYDQLIRQFELEFPNYYNLKYNLKTLDIDELQALITPKTCLISYYISSESIYIFAINSKEFDLKIVALASKNELHDLIKKYIRSIKMIKRRDFIKLSSQIYDILLQPIQNCFQNIEQLVVIPDAELFFLPFETLLTQKTDLKTPYYKLPYLNRNFSLSYHYSVTLMADSISKGILAVEEMKSFAGFAPIYTEQSNHLQEKIWSEKLEKQSYEHLLHSESEINYIADLFQKNGKPYQCFLHEEATIKNFLQATGEFQYVLVAAHGFLDKQRPEMSGIVFAKPSKEVEKENERHLFYIADAYNLKLDVDLVVLSCCESGIGKVRKGEGMIAMNRGFLYSGAKNIIYTLFKVYDKASSQLIQDVFAYILKGYPYHIALRQAKLKLIGAETTTPKSWAGFVLIGQ